MNIGSYELTYFRNSGFDLSTIENFKNFRLEQDAIKLVPIDRVVRFIERDLDLSDFHGKMFTEYTRLQAYKLLKAFLDQISGIAIRSYTIKSIEFVPTGANVGTIVNTFSIEPIQSLEEFDIAMEV